MAKEITVEIKVKFDELVSQNELDIISMYIGKTQSYIVDRLEKAITEQILPELKTPKIDEEELKQAILNRIAHIKAREVLEREE